MPEITVETFAEDLDTFLRYGRNFYKSNEIYRGYDDIIELINAFDLATFDLYQVLCDGVIVGVAGVRAVEPVLHLDIFVVDEQFRGIGVGDAFFESIVTNNKYKNFTEYESLALPGDRSTKNFFEQRQGKARLLIVGGPIVRS